MRQYVIITTLALTTCASADLFDMMNMGFMAETGIYPIEENYGASTLITGAETGIKDYNKVTSYQKKALHFVDPSGMPPIIMD